MKILFLDESGDHSLIKVDDQFPIFCLAGCIFDEQEYYRTANAKIDAFKLKYFNDTDVILHSREVRKCEPPFNILLNPETKKKFYTDLNNLMTKLPFTIVASVILKQQLKDQYSDPANPYRLSLQFIVERFLYFLEEVNDTGYISAESRDPKSNTDLLNTFTNLMHNGSYGNSCHVTAERFQKRIQKMDFVTKQKNENGHQIADLVAYPTARFGMKRKSNPSFDVLKPKFRKSRGGRVKGYGLKIFPN